MSQIPFIPDSAPFTPSQRAWLNGYLAGLFSEAASTAPAEKPQALRVAVLYASQSGTAEGLARKLAKELKAKGNEVNLSSLDGYTPVALSKERYAIFIASTYGEGDAPDGSQSFFDQLSTDSGSQLQHLSYAVLALGDSHYEHFCKFGADLEETLASKGAVRLCDRVDCDVELDETFASWKQSLHSALESIKSSLSTTGTCQDIPPPSTASSNAELLKASTKSVASSHTRETPLFAPIIDQRPLTHSASSKVTVHISFCVTGSDIAYEAGDACGVVPTNDKTLVEEIIAALDFDPYASLELPKLGTTSLVDALTHHLQITRLTRKLIHAYAEAGRCDPLLSLLVPQQHLQLEEYIWGRDLIDLIQEYPGVLCSPSDLVAVLPRLAPRLYSISSSPAAHAGEVHTTVAVVRYESHHRERGGVCSTQLAHRLSIGDTVPIYIHPNKKFRLPQAADTPVIMIGPGTGVAPFRAFLHERRAHGATGKNWLFFGERSAATDFFYRDELQSMHTDGHLTRLDTAFSRDQHHKIYVQDKMAEHGAQLWSWIQDGASVYVCGDATHMAKDVDSTLHLIASEHGRMDKDAARDFIQNLKDQHRYQRDVY